MSVKFGKTEAKKFLKLLENITEPTDEDLEHALAALEVAAEIYESRASWMIVAGLASMGEDGENLEGQFWCIGPYSTVGDARNALNGETLANQANERILAYIHHGSPASLLTERKKGKQAAEAAERGKDRVPWLITVHERDAEKARVERMKAGLLSPEDLMTKYPNSGYTRGDKAA